MVLKNKVFLISALIVIILSAVTGCGGGGTPSGGGTPTPTPVSGTTPTPTPEGAPDINIPTPDPADGGAVGESMTVGEIASEVSNQIQFNTAINMEILQLFAANPGGNSQPIEQPETTPPSSSSSLRAQVIPGWFGPDANGWYWRQYRCGYGDSYWFTEMIRSLGPPKNVVEYVSRLYYYGADGSFEYETSSRIHTRDDGLLDGYYDMKTSCSGFETIGDAEYKYVFTGFNLQTGAGYFEWWMGGSSLGGNYEPFSRFLSMDATLKSSGPPVILHVHAHCYDPGCLQSDWEYDTSYSPGGLPTVAASHKAH